jgi:hypothetical protein
MTVAIKRAKGDIIWFDAVLQFNRQNSASVSKHPLETGSYITDHTTTENPIITISGVITDVDFNIQRPKVEKEKQFVNNKPLPNNIVTVESDGGKYKEFLPESISQFFEDQPPHVNINPITRPKTAEAIEDDLIQIWKDKEAVTLMEFKGSVAKERYDNCIITNLTFNESSDSGDALWPSITLEQVAYAKSTNVKIPQKVAASVKNAASPTNGKGTQAAAPAKTDAPTSGGINFSQAVASQMSKIKDSVAPTLFGR